MRQAPARRQAQAVTEAFDAAIAHAITERAKGAGLKADIPLSRISRIVRAVAAAHGVDVRAVGRPPLVDEAVEQLAIHESWFFRDAGQFKALARHIVPTLTPPVRVWCAGCADGQEAWSLAMLLADHVDGDWHVTASDFSAAALKRAERGVYRATRLRGLSTDHRSRFLQAQGDEWAVRPTLRPHVTFVRHNIATEPLPVPAASCDVVLCRNVLIYLHPDAVAAALKTLEQAMTREAWLLLGGAESLFGITDRFTTVALDGAFVYRRADLAAAPTTPPATRRKAAAPRVPPTPPAPDIETLLAEAATATGEGRHDDAARAFRQAAYLEPSRVEAHIGLAEALEAVGDKRGAARARAAALRLRP